MSQREFAVFLNDAARSLTDAAKTLSESAQEMRKQLAVANADVAGRLAQIRAMEAEHPSSPLLAESGRVFQTKGHVGLPKTELRLLYEAAFDKHLHGENIPDPASCRLD